ncbi:hypothetical protein QF031_000032 [Pseudarthrobacter defluvii]|uniref:AAA family ATPase n=1 Tax=Pseudarthrobacter defluvii TaxID=410837 RepID=UPI002784ADC6|nr:ATP-binding protein [Pseudarthrobacter defluvii]MDQ0767283.1 hypothetical protein [Pseudarthrobacter defluvii]
MSADQRQRNADRAMMEAAMTWLRLILDPSVEPAAHPAPAASKPPVPDSSPPSQGWRRRRRLSIPQSDWSPRDAGVEDDELALLLPPSKTDHSAPQELRRARLELEQAMAGDPVPRFTRFCDAFKLFPFERDVALLCLGHAVSTEVARLCAAMPESFSGLPTFALALGLAADPQWEAASEEEKGTLTRLAAVPEWDALAPDRPLRTWRMLDIVRTGGEALISCPLRMDERIVNHLMGLDYLDERLAALLEGVPADDGGAEPALSGSQQSRAASAIVHLRRPTRVAPSLLVQLPGGDSVTKRLFAQQIVDAAGLQLQRLPLDQLGHNGDPGSFLRLWNRETRLQQVALLIDATEASGETLPILSRLLDGVEGLVLVDVPEPLPRQDTALILDVARPEPAEQRSVWQRELRAGSEWPERLAGQFDLNVAEISEAAAVGLDAAGTGDDPGQSAWEACRSRARPRLEGLAQRSTSLTRLSDVQLAANEMRLLEQVRDQTRNRLRVYDDFGFRGRLSRGLGITALLAGESGTGKTMAAEALANELGLDLYRIDLSSVVSKYIGETEKNIRRVFDAAEQSGAVLLFDEADAIFGKRSEVHDSHDRYANIEVSYVLQRMEAYAGLAILTTNMKNALDPAFLRRLRFIVTFSYPGGAERERIWRNIFPSVPGADPAPPEFLVPGADRLDFQILARASLTGGQIRNIAVNGAFLAAAGDGTVTMELLREAARDELRKHGKPIAAADFTGWVTPVATSAQPSDQLFTPEAGEVH